MASRPMVGTLIQENLQACKHVFCQEPLTLEENQLIRNARQKYHDPFFIIPDSLADAAMRTTKHSTFHPIIPCYRKLP
jgi:hypothetical protein